MRSTPAASLLQLPLSFSQDDVFRYEMCLHKCRAYLIALFVMPTHSYFLKLPQEKAEWPAYSRPSYPALYCTQLA